MNRSKSIWIGAISVIAVALISINSYLFLKLELAISTMPSTDPPLRAAFVCYINGPFYLVQAAVLAYSLRLVNSSLEKVIMVTDPDEFVMKSLERYFDRVIPISPIIITGYKQNTEPGNTTITQILGVYPKNFTEEVKLRIFFSLYASKLRMLQLLEYDVVIYLGTDQIVLKNIDRIANCPTPCGVVDTILHNMVLCSIVVNGDLLVLKPSQKDFENIMDNVNKLWFEYWMTTPFGPFDQYAINHYFLGSMTGLSYDFGLEVQVLETYPHYRNEKVHVLHWASYHKPWSMTKSALKEMKLPQEVMKAAESWWNIEKKVLCRFGCRIQRNLDKKVYISLQSKKLGSRRQK